MQNDPVKISGNYNECPTYHSPHPVDLFEEILKPSLTPEQVKTVKKALEYTVVGINDVLGGDNKLTRDVNIPKIKFGEPDPHLAGYFDAEKNEIGIMVKDPNIAVKVLIHELAHFYSHNGKDPEEIINSSSPISKKNNVGFRRNYGLDIREGAEGTVTRDYFLSWNEAVTEQFAIDILPGSHETYHDYRGLLNQVIDDAVAVGLGSEDEKGIVQAWSRDQFKDYIFKCFFKGDLEGFTKFLKTIYAKYDITEQQFGLMTHKDDLPSVIEKKIIRNGPDDPPPTLNQIANYVQQRLNQKTSDDYVTDIIDPEPKGVSDNDFNKYGVEYDTWVKKEGITFKNKKIFDGVEYEYDNQDHIIYRGNQAESALEKIKEIFDDLFVQMENGEIDKSYITKKIDEKLFTEYSMSMLSDGFRNFYIYKHKKMDNKELKK